MNQVTWNLDRFEISPETRRKLMAVYPHFLEELPKMEMWYLANPRKKKKNHYRFIINWLNKKEKTKPVDKYKIANTEFNKKLESLTESAPPPDDWLKLKEKLSRGV